MENEPDAAGSSSPLRTLVIECLSLMITCAAFVGVNVKLPSSYATSKVTGVPVPSLSVI